MRVHVPTVAALLLVGCFSEPDYEGRLCGTGAQCPAGFACGDDGRCHQGSMFEEGEADASLPDAAASGDSTVVVTMMPDASVADTSVEPDASSTQEQDGGTIANPARCSDPTRYPTTGWEARTFSLDSSDRFQDCLSVDDLATDGIDRNFDRGGPIGNVVDRFGTRYTARRTFQPGVQTFTLTHDDGIRVYVGGELVYENWTRGTVAIGVKVLSPYLAGDYDIVVEHFENDGLARIAFSSQRGCGTIEDALTGWNVAYYRRLAGDVIDYNECFGVEQFPDDQFSHDWGSNPPLPDPMGINDGWAAVGHAQRSLSGLTQFNYNHDDGLRMTIGGTVVYDQLTAGPQNQISYVYGVGSYSFMFELIENTGLAHADVSWTNYCSLPLVITDQQWAVRYYGVTFDGTTWDLNYDDCLYQEVIDGSLLNFDWQASAPSYLLGAYSLTDLWGASYLTVRTFNSNTTVTLGYDDGLRAYIDGTLAYDDWNAPQVVTAGGLVVPSGQRRVELEYFENQGWAGLHFNY